MDQQKFQDFILEHGIIGFFESPMTLKSGRQSQFYVNWRAATNDAWMLDKLTDFICDFLSTRDWQFDTLYGVPEGASKTAVITAMKLARRAAGFAKGSHNIAMGRARPKEHGHPDDRYFIGAPRGRTVVLEDTITTGGSLIACLQQLLEAGVDVAGVVALTDRMEKRDDGYSVEEYLNLQFDGKIPYRVMSDALTLLPLAAQKYQPSRSILDALEAEFAEFGVMPLRNL